MFVEARNLRKRAKRNVVVATADPVVSQITSTHINSCASKGALYNVNNNNEQINAPPIYCVNQVYLPAVGTSPPPTYEDSLLDQLYLECNSSEGGDQQKQTKKNRKLHRQSTSSASSKNFKR